MLASDCPWCSLLGKAILRIRRRTITNIAEYSDRFRHRPVSRSGVIHLDGCAVRVDEAVISIRYSYRNTFGHNVERIFHTKLGHGECSSSTIPVARELQDPLTIYKDI